MLTFSRMEALCKPIIMIDINTAEPMCQTDDMTSLLCCAIPNPADLGNLCQNIIAESIYIRSSID